MIPPSAQPSAPPSVQDQDNPASDFPNECGTLLLSPIFMTPGKALTIYDSGLSQNSLDSCDMGSIPTYLDTTYVAYTPPYSHAILAPCHSSYIVLIGPKRERCPTSGPGHDDLRYSRTILPPTLNTVHQRLRLRWPEVWPPYHSHPLSDGDIFERSLSTDSSEVLGITTLKPKIGQNAGLNHSETCCHGGRDHPGPLFQKEKVLDSVTW